MPQPPRSPRDGAIRVERLSGSGDGDIALICTTDGHQYYLWASEFNAWRLLASLAVVLGVELPKKIAKSIRM